MKKINNYEKIAASINDLVDNRIGIIQKVFEERPVNGSPPFYHYCSYTSNTIAFCQQENFRHSRGVAVSKERALAKALGESIERYCSAIYNKESLPFCSYVEANFSCIHPNEFVKYSPELYYKNSALFFEFTDTQKVRWTEAIDITNNNEKLYVPAGYIYLPYTFGKYENRITQNISTGLACHTSYEMAAITAICEVIERDAFMIFWRNKLSPPKIDHNSLPKYLQKIIDSYEEANQEVFLFDITTDIQIPTILATIRCVIPGNPALIVAGSCNLSPESAILSALEELELTRLYSLNMISNKNKNSTIAAHNIKNQEDHLFYWSQQSNLHLSNFLFDSTKIKAIDELFYFTNKNDDDLSSMLEIFKKLNLRILLADLTTPDILDSGFHVIRAVIPGLHPLTFGYKNDEFICQRLQTVPDALRLTISNTDLDKSYIPHPFP